jgi:hypothetical protein
MKEQELIKMINTTKNIEGKMVALISQINNMKDLMIGTVETLKRMPGYEEALENLKKDISEEPKLEK